MKVGNVFIICLLLSACQTDSEIVEAVMPIIVDEIAEEEEYKSSYISPIGDFADEPYKTTLPDEPEYLTPIYTNMTASYVAVDMGTVHSSIEESRLLSDYEIALDITYRYRVKMDIHLDNGMCVSGWFWNDKETTWSDENLDCVYNYPVYGYDDFIAIYGNATVSTGNNFTVTFARAGSLDVEWLIR